MNPSNSVVDEDALVRQHLGVARRVAMKLAQKVPRNVDREALFAAACEGVLLAVRSYDPTRGSTLKAWCAIKARGACIDWLRIEGGGRNPDKQHAIAYRVSIDTNHVRPVKDSDHSATPIKNVLVGDTAASVTGPLEARDLVEWLLRGLLPAERAIAVGCLANGQPQAEVADENGVSHSWASLLTTSTIALLRDRLALLESRIAQPPRQREEAEQRALERIQTHGATIAREDGRIAVTIGPPHPLFDSPVICWGDDLAEVAENLEQTIRQRQTLPLARKGAQS
ncbi:MAG: sigma-70 family RNA polymerase sigma factor [Gemmataceae bacterium]|nr:sigma-70 family RNA polymerase sigma factor [Gemmataceae bacterium]